ncbi:MAG TPA: GtrA family protein [Acidimicrobiales bacterium]|nr:GtrA family protein [Acidimicrobiales bacterium]
MREAALRLWRFYNTPKGKKLFRYSMVSVISTCVAQLTLFIVYGVLRVWSAVPSNIFANAVATIPSYYLNRNWAWGKSGRSHLMREVVPFWVMSFAGMALSILTVGAAEHWGKAHGLHHLGLTVVVQAANLFAFAVLWVLKFLLFNRLFQTNDPKDEEADLVEASSAV